MKLLKNKWILIALCAILLTALFFVCQRRIHTINEYRIDENRVERITFEDRPHSRELTAEETERFIKLFNSGIYGGESTGDGTTPDYNFTVYFKDGSYMWVNDFNSMRRKFEVSVHNSDKTETSGYYVKSQALWNFMLNLAEE